MNDELNDLNSQTLVVIKHLMKLNGMQRNQAMLVWAKSKTKARLEELELFYVSGMRCYYELQLEIENNPKWMRDPFE